MTSTSSCIGENINLRVVKATLFLWLFFLSSLAFQVNSQTVEFIAIQYQSILKAKKVEEKLMRNCKMGRLIPSNQCYDFEKNRITQEPNLNELEGFSDLLEDSNRIRMISWSFPLDQGYHQYSLGFICKLKSRDGFLWSGGASWCDNALDLNCRPCGLGDCGEKNWEGAVYRKMSSFRKDSLLYLHLTGEQYFESDTKEVNHVFSVSPSCNVDFLGKAKEDAVR